MKAKKIEVEPFVLPDVITISLNEEEAAALFAILSQISGTTDTNNPRDVVTDGLWHEINEVLEFFNEDSCRHEAIVEKYYRTIYQGTVIKTP